MVVSARLQGINRVDMDAAPAYDGEEAGQNVHFVAISLPSLAGGGDRGMTMLRQFCSPKKIKMPVELALNGASSFMRIINTICIHLEAPRFLIPSSG